MDYKLNIVRTFRYRHHKKGVVEVAVGTYAVPDLISDKAAQLAIAQGIATRIEVPKQQPAPSPTAAAAPDAKPKPKYIRRTKRSPEDKMRGNAPDNKSMLV